MLKLSPCGCGPEFLVRIERSWWMRVFTWKRLYFCTQCRRRLFIARPRGTLPLGTRPQALAARDEAQRHPNASLGACGHHAD